MGNWGEARAKERGKRVATVWRDTIACSLVAGVAGGVAANAETPWIRWSLFAVALVAVAWALWVGSVRYFAVIDEQERMAAYWSGMVGLYTYALLFGAQIVGERFGLVVPHGHHWVFWGVFAVTMVAFLWKRYR